MANQKNSNVSLMERVALLQKNATEIITRLNDVVSTNANSVSVELLNNDGTRSSYELPTVGKLKADIDLANQNINRLAGLEGATTIQTNGTSQKIFTVDLNREPFPINDVGAVNNFKEERNWFFESLMNPLISVNLDLANKIGANVRQIWSRRYIVRFEKDSFGNLTSAGESARQEFVNTFIGKNDILLSDFLTWYTNRDNLGIVDNQNPDRSLDEQLFDLNTRQLNYRGTFSVLKVENDTLNKKLWYHLNTLNYEGRDNSIRKLSIGDQLILNRRNSSTRYKIIDVSVASSLFRVELERIEGYDPVPVGENTLRYYSTLTARQSVDVSIGYDEYNVVFVKPVNTENYVESSQWSLGTAFYTNDLLLNTNTNVNFETFYASTVADYGAMLKDLTERLIPTSQAVKPNAVVLNNDNFRVVQTNKHLTNNENSRELKRLNSKRLYTKSRINAINRNIISLNETLSTRELTRSDRERIELEISKNDKRLATETSSLASTIEQILASRTDASIEPTFAIRGFFEYPSPINQQDVIQFRIEYRRAAKEGNIDTTEAFEITNTGGTTTTGYYSNWIPYHSILRKRSFNAGEASWTWENEDISNGEEPNSNQLNIPIRPNEKIEVRIRAISEAGWPDALIYADWSNLMTIEFPDELSNQTLSIADQNIVEETYKDQALIEMQQSIENQGIVRHVTDSFFVNEEYFAHKDFSISTSFIDEQGNSIDLETYLNTLTTKISQLEEIVARAKGELQVSLFNNANETILGNNSTTPILIECEDFAEASGSTGFRTYYNDIYIIKDYSLIFKNIAEANPLGLLSDRLYTTGNTTNTFFQKPDNQALYVNEEDYLLRQLDHQFIWFADTHNGQPLYEGLYKSEMKNASFAVNALNQPSRNLGGENDYPALSTTSGITANANNLIGDVPWSGATPSPETAGGFLATVHPVIKEPLDIVETGQEKTKILTAQEEFIVPLNIYFRFNYETDNTYSVGLFNRDNNTLNRAVKCFVEVEGESRPFEFTIGFTLRQHKTATYFRSLFNRT
jgi:hypothetical protein